MEQAILNLMDQALNENDVKYINDLELELNLGDDFEKIIEGIKVFYFKKGFKSGLNIINYCEK